MKKLKLITTPARLSRAYLDSLSDIDNQAWEVKAERLQARRWRKLRQQLV